MSFCVLDWINDQIVPEEYQELIKILEFIKNIYYHVVSEYDEDTLWQHHQYVANLMRKYSKSYKIHWEIRQKDPWSQLFEKACTEVRENMWQNKQEN
jgi:hypothetical protein